MAEHLVTLYLRKKLSIDKPDSLLAIFYSKASEELCGHIIHFLGESLNEPASIWDDTSLQKLQSLWEHRVSVAGRSQLSRIPRNEYAQFGWWFISGKFDHKWSLEQLQIAIQLGGQPELVYKAIDHLAILAPLMPFEATECLIQIIECEKKGLIPLGRRESIKTILGSAIKSKDENTRRTALGLVNKLGAKGLVEYRTLLKKI